MRGKLTEQSVIIQRQLQVLQLRQTGWSYRDIGDKLGITHTQAIRDMKNAVAELNEAKHESTADYVTLELARLDMLTKGLEPMAEIGNIGAVGAYVKVMERRAKLLGLDAPEKKDVTSGGEKLEIVIRNAND